MTNGENYDGAEESIRQLIKITKKVYRFYKGPEIPKDPKEVIELAKKVREDEHLRIKAEDAANYIKKTWKERDQELRRKRRAKIKKLFGVKS